MLLRYALGVIGGWRGYVGQASEAPSADQFEEVWENFGNEVDLGCGI